MLTNLDRSVILRETTLAELDRDQRTEQARRDAQDDRPLTDRIAVLKRELAKAKARR